MHFVVFFLFLFARSLCRSLALPILHIVSNTIFYVKRCDDDAMERNKIEYFIAANIFFFCFSLAVASYAYALTGNLQFPIQFIYELRQRRGKREREKKKAASGIACVLWLLCQKSRACNVRRPQWLCPFRFRALVRGADVVWRKS